MNSVVQQETVQQQNKRVVERLYRDCINPGNVGLVEELIATDFTGPRGEKGPAGFAQSLASLRAGFPDVQFTIEDLIAEGDRVVARWRMQGTHLGPFAGFAASNKPVTQTAIVIYQLRDSKIVRTWLQPDTFGLLQQIGVIPDLGIRPPRA